MLGFALYFSRKSRARDSSNSTKCNLSPGFIRLRILSVKTPVPGPASRMRRGGRCGFFSISLTICLAKCFELGQRDPIVVGWRRYWPKNFTDDTHLVTKDCRGMAMLCSCRDTLIWIGRPSRRLLILCLGCADAQSQMASSEIQTPVRNKWETRCPSTRRDSAVSCFFVTKNWATSWGESRWNRLRKDWYGFAGVAVVLKRTSEKKCGNSIKSQRFSNRINNSLLCQLIFCKERWSDLAKSREGSYNSSPCGHGGIGRRARFRF